VREAVRVTVIAAEDVGSDAVGEDRADYGKRVVPGSRKAGVVWHTQGSGKSISMVCYAGKLLQQPEMKNPTIVVVTDRNDLDTQAVFGDYVSIYDIRDAVEDGATVEIFYESRLAKLDINRAEIEALSEEVEEVIEDEEDVAKREHAKGQWAALERMALS
jgi:type I site-specific restriction-modification system R (restriction) subunit